MPGFDRSGPYGEGPMTGRGLGRCNPNLENINPDEYNYYGVGRGGYPRGGGRGFGWGGGRGRRFGFRGRFGRGMGFGGRRGRFFSDPYPQGDYNYEQYDDPKMIDTEIKMMKDEANYLNEQAAKLEEYKEKGDTKKS